MIRPHNSKFPYFPIMLGCLGASFVGFASVGLFEYSAWVSANTASKSELVSKPVLHAVWQKVNWPPAATAAEAATNQGTVKTIFLATGLIGLCLLISSVYALAVRMTFTRREQPRYPVPQTHPQATTR